MWLWWCLTALAAEPTVALPVDEAPAQWEAPLRMAGLRPGASGEAGRIYDRGSQWEVCVPRPAGPTCAMLAPPTTDRQREDVAWLVVSLGQELVLSAGSATSAAATNTSQPAAMPAPVPVVTATAAPEPPKQVRPPSSDRSMSPTPSPPTPPPAAPARPPPSSTPVAPVAPVASPAPPPVVSAPARVVPPPAPVRAAEGDGPAMALDAVSEEPTPASDPPQAPPEPVVLFSPPAAAPSSSILLTDLRIGVGARWQASEGQSALLSGELRGPSGLVTPAVTAVMDSPLTLSDVPLRRTWTTTAGAWALWQPGRVELGLGLGLEHQRWWQDGSLVQSTWRPQVGLRGGGCPADGPLCIAGLVGWSVRRVAEREEGAEDLTVALPLHLSIQTHLRRTR